MSPNNIFYKIKKTEYTEIILFDDVTINVDFEKLFSNLKLGK